MSFFECSKNRKLANGVFYLKKMAPKEKMLIYVVEKSGKSAKIPHPPLETEMVKSLNREGSKKSKISQVQNISKKVRGRGGPGI